MFHAEKRLLQRTDLKGVSLQQLELEIKEGRATCIRFSGDPDRIVYEIDWLGIPVHALWSIQSRMIITVLPLGKGKGHQAYANKKQTRKAFFRDLRRSGEEDCDDI
jgi:hypothetical protein